jgi:hypothetical protein
MNCNLKITLLFFISFLVQHASAQLNYFGYKKYKHEWPEAKPSPMQVDQVFKHEDLVVLKDERLISVGGSLGSTTNVLIQRQARLKFLTPQGIVKNSTVILPESLDPLYDYHNTPFVNNRISKGPCYFELALNKFAARVIKADGRIIVAPYKEEHTVEENLTLIYKQSLTSKFVKNHFWTFLFENLEPGDELEYYYQLMIPYADNFIFFNSSRIFFNTETACQDYSLVFKYRTGPAHVLTYINGAEPDSTAIIEKVKYHYWNKKNLHGCLKETGARPHETLPHIVYALNTEPDMFQYNDPVTSAIKYIPAWLHILRFREHFDFLIRKNAENNVKDKQNLLVDAYINSQTEGINDSLVYLKLSKIHNNIAENFKYLNDEALFREEENRAERLGEFTQTEKIREVSRQKLYAKILNKLKLDYFTVYLMDKRYGKIDEKYQSPMWNTECLYAAIINSSTALMHPKKSDFGWYIEEMPFYWENTTGLIATREDLFYIFPDKPKIITTSGSSLNDNIRTNNVMATIDLDAKKATFEARVSLSGQYSTMTRMLYSHKINDSINNPLYNKKISHQAGNVRSLSEEITSKKTNFPFKFDVKSTFENENTVENSGENYLINLSGWFNHIIYDSISTMNRQLSYYPDFTGQDLYRYYIKFNKPVTLQDLPENVEIKNAFGNLTIIYSQPQPDALLIESQFITTSEMVSAAKIGDVVKIFNEISRLNSSKILLRL